MKSLKLLMMGLFVLLICPSLFSENPSFQRAKYGQVAYSDNQIFYKAGSVSGGSSSTFRVQSDQNHFIFAAKISACKVSFSQNQNGPFLNGIDVLADESLTLAFEIASGTYCNILFPSATGTYRFIATGRSDGLNGTID